VPSFLNIQGGALTFKGATNPGVVQDAQTGQYTFFAGDTITLGKGATDAGWTSGGGQAQGPDVITSLSITLGQGNQNLSLSGVTDPVTANGSGPDNFQFKNSATISGTLDGRGGQNMLDYSGYGSGVTVNLSAGSATGVGSGGTGVVSNIQNVTGSAFDDTITGSAQVGILIGGGGSDTLQAGDGRSILIGGAGSDTLRGGAADDILIGGTTSYDSGHLANLLAILAEWQSADDYATRIAFLTNGGGHNGNNTLVFGGTVQDDGAVNMLTGNGATDWFFQGALDTLTDNLPGEQVNNP
jgi:Ca2+-binding RTX toxin-like protein